MAVANQGEADLAFAKIAVLRRLVTQTQIQECFRALGQVAMEGKESSLATILVEKGMIPRSESDQIVRMIEAGQVVPELPGYTLLHELGRGGMGAVYKGIQTALDRPVAIKILFPELARNERYLTRFLNEAKAVARLQHPNIVSAIDVGEAGGFNYFAMEFVEGNTIANLVRNQGKLDEKYALDVTMQTARALEHAWKHKLVHRDVKPENIIMANDGCAKLADLGIAKQVDSDTSLTMDGGVVGSPNYISPEQANGVKDIDTRSDIYSLGGTLYFMLVGEPPYKGESAAVVMAQHMVAKLPDPRAKVPTISSHTVKLYERMMAKDRAQRPADPTALIVEIEAVKAALASGKADPETANTIETTRPNVRQAAGGPGNRAGSQVGMASVKEGARAKGQRGSSAENRKLGTAEARALSGKEAQRLARKNGLDPKAWAGIAAVGVAGIGLVLYFTVINPGKRGGGNTVSNNAVAGNNAVANNAVAGNVPRNVPPTNNGAPDGALALAEKEGREAFEYVQDFEKKNPTSFEEILDKYQKVQERFSGKTWGFKAEDAVKRVTDAWKAALAQSLSGLDAALKPLVEQKKFGAAMTEFEQRFKRDQYPALIRGELESRWAGLQKLAQDQFEATIDAAEKAIKSGSYQDAINLYKGVAANFGLPRYLDAANTHIKEVEQAWELDKARKLATAARELQSRYLERLKSVRDQVVLWEFQKALQTVDQEKGFQGTPYESEWKALRQDCERFLKFKATLLAGLAAKKIKVDAKAFLLDQAMNGTLTGGSEQNFDISLKPSGKMSLKWSTLKPDETLNLARAALDRGDPQVQITLGAMALLFGQVDKAMAELKSPNPDVQDMLRRVQAQVGAMERAEMDGAIGRVSALVDAAKFTDAVGTLGELRTKYADKLHDDQKTLLEGLERSIQGGLAETLLDQARDHYLNRRNKEALEVISQLLTKYPNSSAARDAAGLRDDIEAKSVLRVCDFEKDAGHPWQWEDATARFSLNDDPQFVKDGKYSGRVIYPAMSGTTLPCVWLRKVEDIDWSAYDTFSMWVYAPSRTGDKLGIRAFVQGEDRKFSYDYTVDWEGWKELRIPFSKFLKTGSASWDQIREMALPILSGKGETYYYDDLRVFKAGK